MRSRSVAAIRDETLSLVAQGAREITLLGQNLDAFGQDRNDGADLGVVLRSLHPIADLRRLRFLTSHPADMRDDFVEAVAELPKVCEHFELPVQSGSDAVLHRMVRRYSVAEYVALVERIRQRIPHASLGTDVIVGFPGETAAQFEETLRLLETMRFDVVHVAAYSPRPGTAASRLPDDVSMTEKERRRQAVEKLQERISEEINRDLLGETVEILVEDRRKGRWRGRTRSSKLVFVEDDRDLRGQEVRAQVKWAGPWSMLGTVQD